MFEDMVIQVGIKGGAEHTKRITLYSCKRFIIIYKYIIVFCIHHPYSVIIIIFFFIHKISTRIIFSINEIKIKIQFSKRWSFVCWAK